MSQLRASINFSLREKELQQHQIQFLDPNANPIETDIEISEIPAPNSNDEDSEDDIEDDANIITSEHWEQELREWEEMLFQEELARMEDEEALRDDSNNSMKGDLLNEYTHPAIDKKAKWELRNLFSTFLNAKFCIELRHNPPFL
jgi:hypothetical protein